MTNPTRWNRHFATKEAARAYWVDWCLRRVATTRAWLYEYKQERGCQVCNENDPRCLDFHHRDRASKVATVSWLVKRARSIERVLEEIERCDLLCANCHRKLHTPSFAPDEEGANTMMPM